MMPHIYKFSTSISDAYRKSLVQIFDQSLNVLNKSLPNLSSEFEAFSAAAFLQAHEIPVDLSKSFATRKFIDILLSSVQSLLSQKQENHEKEDLFKTSYATGQTSLNDVEIFEIVKKRPVGEYLSKIFLPLEVIPEDQIASFHVSRNKTYIEVEIMMINGSKFIYQYKTNHLKTLNLEHDRQILLSAASLLKSKYEYIIPEVPQTSQNDSEESYEKCINECLQHFEFGRKHLLNYFLEISRELSECKAEDNTSISDRYAEAYAKGLAELQTKLPPFIGDVQTFLSTAMAVKE